MTAYSDDDLQKAHRHSIHHRAELETGKLCGCFYCLQSFTVQDVNEWTDDGTTALCPKCGIDSVIGSESGFPVGDRKFLSTMNEVWFRR